MYVPAVPLASHSTQVVVGVFRQAESDWEWLARVLRHLWDVSVPALEVLEGWLEHLAPSLSWTIQVLSDAYSFVQTHPHPFHILAWSLFFGPIIVLVPCLLLLELLILLLFHLSFVAHGFTPLVKGVPWPVEDRFEALKEHFADTRESLFATVERWTAVFNRWTTGCAPLMVLRVVAALVGTCLLVGIWCGWE